MSIWHAILDDAGLLTELGTRTFSEAFAAENRSEDMAAYLASSFTLKQQTAELADPAITCRIAEIDGVATGRAQNHLARRMGAERPGAGYGLGAGRFAQ